MLVGDFLSPEVDFDLLNSLSRRDSLDRYTLFTHRLRDAHGCSRFLLRRAGAALSGAEGFLEWAHLLLFFSGQVVLTAAAALFLAYIVLMSTILSIATVRGWFLTLRRRLAGDRASRRRGIRIASLAAQS